MINISVDLFRRSMLWKASIEASHKRAPSPSLTPPYAREATKQTHKMFVLWLLVHVIRRCASRMHAALSSCTLPFTPGLPPSRTPSLALTRAPTRPRAWPAREVMKRAHDVLVSWRRFLQCLHCGHRDQPRVRALARRPFPPFIPLHPACSRGHETST